MQPLINTIKDANIFTAIARKTPISMSRARHNSAKAYVKYRQLQLETALASNILESVQFADLARSVNTLPNQRARHGLEAN